MGVDDVTDDAEADAAAAHLRIHRAAAAVERFEDVRQIVRVDAETAIHDANLDLRTANASTPRRRSRPPALYFTALPTMFCTADRSASASPDTGGSVPFEWTAMVTPRSCASCCTPSTASAITCATSTWHVRQPARRS